MYKTCLEIICCKKKQGKTPTMGSIYRLDGVEELSVHRSATIGNINKKCSQSSCGSVGSIFFCVGNEEMHLMSEREAPP